MSSPFSLGDVFHMVDSEELADQALGMGYDALGATHRGVTEALAFAAVQGIDQHAPEVFDALQIAEGTLRDERVGRAYHRRGVDE